MPIRIMLIDDHQIVRQGLRALLERQPDFRVVGEAGDGRTGLQYAADLLPDVVLMDIAMPGLNGIEATRQLHERYPAIHIIALSMHADREFVQNMLLAGATGYLVKESAYEELVRAIRLVLAGQVYVSQKIADLVIKDYIQQLPRAEPRISERLSEREREVWSLLVEGHSSSEVAERLFISVRTVESHRKRIMEKLQAKSLADLVKLAIREGVISLDA